MKTLHIPHFLDFFLELIFTIFYKIIYNNIFTILQFYQFLGGLFMVWGHGVASLVIYKLPLKFGSKQSTLKFWVFGPRAQFLACSPIEIEITLEEKSNGISKFWKFIWAPLEEMNKTQKSFRNKRILVFQPNFCQNSVFTKIEVIFFWNSERRLRKNK